MLLLENPISIEDVGKTGPHTSRQAASKDELVFGRTGNHGLARSRFTSLPAGLTANQQERNDVFGWGIPRCQTHWFRATAACVCKRNNAGGPQLGVHLRIHSSLFK